MSTQSFSVTTDNETVSRVRVITGYDDQPDEISATVMDGLLDAAKSKIYSEADTTAWYTDHNMGEVLVYTLCILSKLRVENYSVERWSLGNESITTLNGELDEGQIAYWMDEINKNLDDSDETAVGGTGVPELTATYDW